jgi:hypothetical protein
MLQSVAAASCDILRPASSVLFAMFRSTRRSLCTASGKSLCQYYVFLCCLICFIPSFFASFMAFLFPPPLLCLFIISFLFAYSFLRFINSIFLCSLVRLFLCSSFILFHFVVYYYFSSLSHVLFLPCSLPCTATFIPFPPHFFHYVHYFDCVIYT